MNRVFAKQEKNKIFNYNLNFEISNLSETSHVVQMAVFSHGNFFVQLKEPI